MTKTREGGFDGSSAVKQFSTIRVEYTYTHTHDHSYFFPRHHFLLQGAPAKTDSERRRGAAARVSVLGGAPCTAIRFQT